MKKYIGVVDTIVAELKADLDRCLKEYLAEPKHIHITLIRTPNDTH